MQEARAEGVTARERHEKATRKDMEQDHCGKPDSHIEFTTGNYGVTTTSAVEWHFVVNPETEGVLAQLDFASEEMRAEMREQISPDPVALEKLRGAS